MMLKERRFLNKSAVVWLPLLLFSITFLLVGFHYETNDDLTLSLLLRGIAIQPPLSNLVLYFHGLSHGLVQLYELVPEWPWYGLVLYALLYIATVIAFLFLRQSGLNKIRFQLIWLLLFFLASWVEHVYWFNYMRVPLLLAGTSYLFLLALPLNKNNGLVPVISGLLFLLALCIRPSAALLGLAVVGPATFLFTSGPVLSWLKWRPVLGFTVLCALFFIILAFTQSPAEKQYQRLDWVKSVVLDFQIYEPQPQTERDKLAFRAIDQWLLADTKVVNAAFYERAGSINLKHILTEVAPFKIWALCSMLVRDHFLVLTINVLLLLFFSRNQGADKIKNQKLFVAYQFYFWLLVLVVGVFLKLPPRVITPCLSLYTLVNAALFLRTGTASLPGSKIKNIAGLVLLFLCGLQLYKISHRARWQQQNQQANEAYIKAVGYTFQEKILVTNVLPDYFRSLSPFRHYNFGSNNVFFLTGWNTVDPANQFYFKNLTGQSDFAGAVAALSRNNNTVWLLTPGFYEFLKVYLDTFHRQEIYLQPALYNLKGQYPAETYRPLPKRP